MFGQNIGFDKPWYLLLLLLLPLLWLYSFHSLSGLGKIRRFLALTLRTLVFACVVIALAEVQWRQTSERLTVMYLLDQSQSIPTSQRQAMMQYVIREVAKHRDNDRRDRAGVIIFGRDATIEIPPFDADLQGIGNIESYLELRTDATNLASAMKLAEATFPEDSAKRVVIVTDGNENQGDARAVAQALADTGVGIDVVPVNMTARAEIAVEKVTLPTDIRKGQPIEARVVVNNYTEPTAENNGGKIAGKLKVMRQSGPTEELLSEQEVVLNPGKNVYSFEHKIDQPAMYTYKADFAPSDPRDDLMPQNNVATAFTHVRGKGHVLVIENSENKGEFDFLAESLRKMNLEVTIMPSDQLFTTLAELQAYDSVVLANTPRASGNDNNVTSFSDEQIEMLVRNTEQLGSGLVMIGGTESYGAGGWTNTELEKAMPVDFQIKNSQVKAVGALVMM
ncbi:MAG TPA: VWA domain-containing protein, partial [Pirellulaceae bacterium]|nr:VWA domain-containing protein [Pirellulaceae bacterium]